MRKLYILAFAIICYMEETVQFNIRLPKNLVYDMEYIAQNKSINRNDWLKYKISKLIKDEKLLLMEEVEREFLRGTIDEEGYEKKMGIKPTEHLLKLKERVLESPKKYFNELMKGTQ